MSQKVEIEIFECSERLPDEDVWVIAFHTLHGWMSLKRSSPRTGSPALLWESEDGPLSYQDEVVTWFFQPERPKPVSKFLYLTCRDGTKLTIPDDSGGPTAKRLGAPWSEIYNNSSLLSAEAEKYVTFRPLVQTTQTQRLTKKMLLSRLRDLEERVATLEHRPTHDHYDDAHFK